MRKYSTSLVTGEMQIKPAPGVHPSQVRVTVIKNKINEYKCWPASGGKEPLFTAGRSINLCCHYGNQCVSFSKV